MDILTFSLLEDKLKKLIKQKCKLNLSQARLLLYFINTNNTKIAMGPLAKKLNISLSTLSRQINQTQTLNLLDLEHSKTNSSKFLCLNKRGVVKADVLTKLLKEIQAQLVKQFGEETLSSFQKQLDTIFIILSKVEGYYI